MKKILILIIVLVLSGCANYQTILKNQDGKLATCRASGFGIIGSLVTKDRFDDCIKMANEMGYK